MVGPFLPAVSRALLTASHRLAIHNVGHGSCDAIPLQTVVFVFQGAGEVLVFQRGKLPGEVQHALAQVAVVGMRGEADEVQRGPFRAGL